MNRPALVTDDDLKPILREGSTISAVVTEVEEFMRDRKRGLVVSPPRFSCETSEGKLVMTSGASERKKLIGLRIYSTFESPEYDSQLTAVYSMDGSLKGIVAGSAVGSLRTAAINAVAIKHLSRHDSKTLGVFGTGRQARAVLPVVSQVRDFSSVLVNSPTKGHASRFVEEMEGELSRMGIEARTEEDGRRLVEKADVVIAVTTASRPVIRRDWLGPGKHVSTMGQKFREAQEIDPGIVLDADMAVTDSTEQLRSYGSLFYVDDASRMRISDLSEHIDGGGRKDDDISVFLSVGLAGTEVVVADRLLSILEKEKGLRQEAPSGR